MEQSVGIDCIVKELTELQGLHNWQQLVMSVMMEERCIGISSVMLPEGSSALAGV